MKKYILKQDSREGVYEGFEREQRGNIVITHKIPLMFRHGVIVETESDMKAWLDAGVIVEVKRSAIKIALKGKLKQAEELIEKPEEEAVEKPEEELEEKSEEESEEKSEEESEEKSEEEPAVESEVESKESLEDETEEKPVEVPLYVKSEKGFLCSYCGKVLKTESAVKKHIAKKHK